MRHVYMPVAPLVFSVALLSAPALAADHPAELITVEQQNLKFAPVPGMPA